MTQEEIDKLKELQEKMEKQGMEQFNDKSLGETMNGLGLNLYEAARKQQ